MKKYINSVWYCILLFATISCSDLDVENFNQPDRSNVFSNKEQIVSLLETTTLNYYANLISSYRNSNFDYLADQASSCSLPAPWYMCKEPRIQLENTIGSQLEKRVFYNEWIETYKVIATVNDIMKSIENLNLSDSERAQIKAGCLFLKGLAMGYVGLIYKEGVVIENSEIAVSDMTLSPYDEVVDKAIGYFEQAKELYQTNTELKWNYLKGFNLSATEVVKLINTYAGKFLLNKARNHKEFATLDFKRIKSYLDNSIENTLTAPGTKMLYNSYQESAGKLSGGHGGKTYGYNVDQKVVWLLSGKAAPKKKSDKDEPEITSIDKRLDLYYKYATQDMFSYSKRDPSLYSNYANVRYAIDKGSEKDGGRGEYHDANILQEEEVLLLKAEVAYGLGDYNEAANLINSSRRVTVGQMPELPADKEAIADALFYENSIELHLAGKAINWMFMRRWDLLQEGTLLHYPVPAQEAELLHKKYFTFGGSGSGDGINVAKGDKAWRK